MATPPPVPAAQPRAAPVPGQPGSPTAAGGMPAKGAQPPLPAIALTPNDAAVPVLDFWQLPFVQNVLPFLTSLAFHLGAVIFAILFIKVGKEIISGPAVREQIIVPDSAIVNAGPEGGIEHPGLGGDQTRDAAQDRFPDVPKDSKGIADKPGPTLQASLVGGGSGDDSGPAVIGIGVGEFGRGTGVGAGKGSGYGSGSGDGTGQLAPFGVPGGGGGVGPKSNFIGMKGNARRIVYVCDASGSMLNMFDSLRVEIRKSVDNLIPTQSFNVLFFQDQGFKAADANALMMANPDSKRRAYDFLDKMFVRGETDPIPALTLAFKQQPELIYLLTDGDFSGPGNEKVVDFCKKMTADGKCKINTIAYIPKEGLKTNPQDQEFVKVLQTIARNSGGQFKHVSDEDMGQR